MTQPKTHKQSKQRHVGKLSGLDRLSDETGAATAEYVIATIAAVGFAGLLVGILRGGAVQSILSDLITSALKVVG